MKNGHIAQAEMGRRISRLGWNTEESFDDLFWRRDLSLDTVCLLSAILQEITGRMENIENSLHLLSFRDRKEERDNSHKMEAAIGPRTNELIEYEEIKHGPCPTRARIIIVYNTSWGYRRTLRELGRNFDALNLAEMTLDDRQIYGMLPKARTRVEYMKWKKRYTTKWRNRNKLTKGTPQP